MSKLPKRSKRDYSEFLKSLEQDKYAFDDRQLIILERFKRLPLWKRDILILHTTNTFKEIADIFHVSTGYIGKLHKRILNELCRQ